RVLAPARVIFPPLLVRALTEPRDLIPARDVAGNCDRLPASLPDAGRNFFARIGLAARDDDLGAKRRHDLCRRAANALARTGDDSHLPAKVEGVLHGARLPPCPKR